MLHNPSAPPATVTPVLVYPDVRAAVVWLEDALGFEERVRIGDTHRSQMRVGADGAVVIADVGSDRIVPEGPGRTHLIKVRVPDVDAAFARARKRGARVVEELTTWEYGERSGVVEDIGGHRWELTQTLRDVEPEEWGGTTVAPLVTVRVAAAVAMTAATHALRRDALSADHLVHGELLDVWRTLRLDSRRRHPFRDPRSEGVEVSA